MFANNTEQMASALKDIAIVAWGYYEDLKGQGFTDEQAFKMVLSWQASLMGGNK
jgi:hypothetical protein